MRTIRLAPDITSFWFMNPGALLFYDRILISEEDYKKIFSGKNSSSFHQYAYSFFERVNKKYPYIFIVDNYHQDLSKYDKKSIELVSFILSNFSNKTILDITVKKYQKWIKFNEYKCFLLSPGEDYREALENIHIKKWKNYLADINSLYQYTTNSDFHIRFNDTPSAIGSFTRLVSRSLQFIDLSKSGTPVYDCMFNDYIDGINITEKAVSLIDSKPYKGNLTQLFSLSGKMRNTPRLSFTSINDFFKNIEKYRNIREKLFELDKIIANISSEDLKNIVDINKCIIDILNTIKSRKIDYAIWLSCFLPLLGYILLPHVTDFTKNLLIDFYIHGKRYGDIFSPYIDFYGTTLKIVDNDIYKKHQYDAKILDTRYDFYLNILRNRL